MDAAPTNSSTPSSLNLIWEGTPTNIWFTNYVTDDGYPYGTNGIWWGAIPPGVSIVSSSNYTSTNIIVTTMATFTNWGLTLTLYATDGFAQTPCAFQVNIRHRPEIHFDAPANGAAILQNTTTILKATATNFDGSISEVHFYDGATEMTPVIPSLNNQYKFSWTNGSLWTHVITAVAKDNDLTNMAQLTVTWVPPLDVRFGSPTNGQMNILSPTNLLLSALVTNYGGASISSVVFSNVTQSISLGLGKINEFSISDDMAECDQQFL